MTAPETLVELAERIAFALSTRHVRECVKSLRSGEGDWRFSPSGEARRTSRYPMSFSGDDNNLYYAIGWGCHVHMWLWERWLVRRAAALRAQAKDSK